MKSFDTYIVCYQNIFGGLHYCYVSAHSNKQTGRCSFEMGLLGLEPKTCWL